MSRVRVHCGSAHVKGTARQWAYYIAQLFVPKARGDGVVTYRATGIMVGPYRSYDKTEREGRELAAKHNAEFVSGYGSLHGSVVS